jgi:hypothetical protein
MLPVSRPLSPLSVDGDSNISVQKNPNRYATSNDPGLDRVPSSGISGEVGQRHAISLPNSVEAE